MSWFGFGKKAKPKPEEEHKSKLDQLQKLGYSDRAKNLQLLKLYAGDVNLVIKDYQIQQPSSQSISPKQEPKKQAAKKVEPKPKPKPTPQPKKEEPKPAPKKEEPKKVESKPKPKPAPIKQEPKKVESKPKPKATPAPKKEEPKPAQSKPKAEPKPKQQSQPKQQSKPAPKEEAKSNEAQKPKAPKGAEMAKPIVKQVAPELVGTSKQPPKQQAKPVNLKKNLLGLPSSDIRQVLLNIGQPTIGEIVFSNGIDGTQFYHYIVVNPLLTKFNVNFGDEPSYSSMVYQVELSYEKHGAIVPKTKLKATPTDEEKAVDTTEKKTNDKQSYETLKSNIQTLISSDVRLLILPYNLELAERLYAFSIGGSDLCKFDYDGVVFATGIKNFSKDNWNKIVTELKLPQSEPFDRKKWEQLQKTQDSVINKAKSVDKQMKDFKQQISKSQNNQNQSSQNENKQNKKQNQGGKKQQKQQSSKQKQLEKQQNKQIQRIVQMEKEADKYLPSQLQKLKQRQVSTLQKLHDIASIVNLDTKTVNDIQQSARKQSEKQLDIYLKSGQIVIPYGQNDDNVTPQSLEKRQLELLSTINRTRAKLEKLAQSKGVSIESLTGITSNLSSSNNKNVQITASNLAVLNSQFDNLFQSLAGIASTLQETAQKYQTKINEDEINKFLVPNFEDLERRQNDQIAKLKHWNDQARMINPKAVQVNEDILHSS